MPKLSLKSVVAATRTLATAHDAGYMWYKEFPQPRGEVRLCIVHPKDATILSPHVWSKHWFASKAALEARMREEGAVWLDA